MGAELFDVKLAFALNFPLSAHKTITNPWVRNLFADPPLHSISRLREYNLLSIQDLTIHEGTPGHYLQLALSNCCPSTLRSILWSGPFVEGWAVYAERVMIDEGYLD